MDDMISDYTFRLGLIRAKKIAAFRQLMRMALTNFFWICCIWLNQRPRQVSHVREFIFERDTSYMSRRGNIFTFPNLLAFVLKVLQLLLAFWISKEYLNIIYSICCIFIGEKR